MAEYIPPLSDDAVLVVDRLLAFIDDVRRAERERLVEVVRAAISHHYGYSGNVVVHAMRTGRTPAPETESTTQYAE